MREAHHPTDVLASAAESDRSVKVRGSAAWAIGQIGHTDSRAVAGLTHLLKESNDDARLRAAWALGQLEDSSALPEIDSALGIEKNADVRRALIRALSKSGGNTAARMRVLIDSKDPQVREAAVRSLAGGRAFGPWPWPWPRPRPWP